jgi:formate dehydrogenase maturation protein FdhE
VVFKSMKETVAAAHRRGVGIKICPVCGSTDISAITMTGYITQPAYTCKQVRFPEHYFSGG